MLHTLFQARLTPAQTGPVPVTVMLGADVTAYLALSCLTIRTLSRIPIANALLT
ncbi:MAG: hypothetical protein ACHQ9S_02610 [Candidatus Binatia bacterium]